MSDAVRLASGVLIFICAILTMISSGFIWLLVIVGAVIMQSAFTGFCPITMLFQKLNLFTDK
ncbi:YgaP family membrane protein [Leucothrix pacifica]